jgi:hypothetical protein
VIIVIIVSVIHAKLFINDSVWGLSITSCKDPVSTRFSTSPRVSQKATELGSPSDETGKNKVPCHSKCSSIKIPPSSKAVSAGYRPNFFNPSQAWMIPYTRFFLAVIQFSHFCDRF